MSSFSISIDELRIAVADYVHGVRDLGGLEAAELARIDDDIRNGLRRFYYPESSGGQVHQWRFLKARRVIDVKNGQRSYKAGPDHGGFEGPLTFDAPNRSDIVSKVSEYEIRQRHDQGTEFTGVPSLYCERWVTSSGVSPQALEIELWPTPSEDATLVGLSVIRPLENGVGREFPAGGPEHAMTIRLACLAEAELTSMGSPGSWFSQFQVALTGSIVRDRTTAIPDVMGYNGRGGPYRTDLRFVRPVGSVNYAN